MADQAISALTALTGANVAADDALAIVDTSVTTTKKIRADELKTYVSNAPTLVTPTLGVAAGTSLALGGATIGTNALAVTGTVSVSGDITSTGGNLTVAGGAISRPLSSGSGANLFRILVNHLGLSSIFEGPNGTMSFGVGTTGNTHLGAFIPQAHYFGWYDFSNTAVDLRLYRAAANDLQLGASGTSVSAQTIRGPTNTTTNGNGAAFYLKGGTGDGSGTGGALYLDGGISGAAGTGGAIIFRAAPASAGATLVEVAKLTRVGGGSPYTIFEVGNSAGTYGTLLKSAENAVGYFGATATQGYTFGIAASFSLGFYSSGPADPSSTLDVMLWRDAASTLALRNSTNAQTINVYGSYTSATDYQRVVVKTVRESSGALSGATYVSTATIPAYAVLIGVTTRVTTLITGATSYSVGDGTDADLWGATIAVAANSQSRTADFTAVGSSGATAAARNVTLTANGGNFTGGVVELCFHYLTTEAD